MNVRQMCRVLTHAGHHVDLLTYPLGRDVELPGLRILRGPRLPGIRTVPIGFSWRKLLLDIVLGIRLTARLALHRYDVVHAVEESVFLALPFTALGVPIIYDLDSLISDQLRYSGVVRSARVLGWIRRLERLALRRARAAITVCAALSDAARALHPGATVYQVEDAALEETLRQPDLERIAALRREWSLEGRRAVVYTGNLELYQGIDLLLDAAKVLRDTAPEAILVLVGGEARQVTAVRERLARDGLEATVTLVGRRPTQEMPEWMGLAEVLVSPRTEGENTPLKLYSYMHSGTPIVATDRRTHTQVLDATTAVLCEPTPEGLAAGIVRVLRDPEAGRAVGERARALAERDYTPAAFERKLLAAYAAVLPQASGGEAEPRCA